MVLARQVGGGRHGNRAEALQAQPLLVSRQHEAGGHSIFHFHIDIIKTGILQNDILRTTQTTR